MGEAGFITTAAWSLETLLGVYGNGDPMQDTQITASGWCVSRRKSIVRLVIKTSHHPRRGRTGPSYFNGGDSHNDLVCCPESCVRDFVSFAAYPRGHVFGQALVARVGKGAYW